MDEGWGIMLGICFLCMIGIVAAFIWQVLS